MAELLETHSFTAPVTSRYTALSALSIFASSPEILNSKFRGAEIMEGSDHSTYSIHHRIPDIPELKGYEFDGPLERSHLEMIDAFVSEDRRKRNENLKTNLPRFAEVGTFLIYRKVYGRSKGKSDPWVFVYEERWDFCRNLISISRPKLFDENKMQNRSYLEYSDNFHALDDSSPTLAPAVFLVAQISKENGCWRLNIKLKGETHLPDVKNSMDYYIKNILPRIFRWALQKDEPVTPIESFLLPKSSLSWISKHTYFDSHDSLKRLHFKILSQVWADLKESTDPNKFIPEDIGIASYIISLWCTTAEKGNMTLPDFIDVGCGNGVLTYILHQSGYKGYGVDIRERKIWSALRLLSSERTTGLATKMTLKEEKLNAAVSVKLQFSDTTPSTWLIGNHSDELTPWIPVWARQTNSSFFIIPCCPFDFVGRFQRGQLNHHGSTYVCYIKHLKTIIENCGFKCYIDRLKIPSTKRICLFGRNDHRNSKSDVEIETYINALPFWMFQPRERTECVGNCTQLDDAVNGEHVVMDIINAVFAKLLTETVLCTEGRGPYGQPWNCGMQNLTLKHAIELLPLKLRLVLRGQGNGIHTILRNHRDIFQIVNGYVQLRPPSKDDICKVDVKNTEKIKTKSCYFFDHHPDGCPLDAVNCRYIHGKS